ncbi:MAG: OmpA family protein [Desulfobacterota bacterium]|nr:OmpA family protein [Thermodesulfobacteriota bacterium]
MRHTLITLSVLVAFLWSGCAEMSKTQKGAAIGAGIGTAVGAGVGYAAGGKKGAAIGAGTGLLVGALSGAAIGKYMDNQERELREGLARAEAASIQREQDILAVTFKSDFLFDVNSSSIKPGAYQEIDRVAEVLKKYPQTRIRIEGHTDSTGSEDYNQRLSEQRAEAVKNALITRGIDPARLETIGLGESAPIADNNTEAGRQMNRRVRVVIIPITA